MTVSINPPLKGKRALVTGGSKGIGAAIVERLAMDGADVVFVDIDEKNTLLVSEKTNTNGVCADLLDFDLIQTLIKSKGPFDILVNNAGVDQHAFFTQTSQDDWRFLLAINLEASFNSIHAVLPTMQANGFGRIINISSEAGRGGSRGGSVYAAAKGGIHAFTKSIALENGKKGITANAICPGPIDTPLLRAAVDKYGEKLLGSMESATVVNRLGTPQEVASLVAYLSREEAGFITGEIIGVSGGMGI